MADSKGALPTAIIQTLLQAGRLRRVDSRTAEQSAARNDAWEARLQRLPSGYLRDYDLLFRYVTRYLLARGLDVGENQPHKMLATILGHACVVPSTNIEDMIRQRHEIKYGRLNSPDTAAEQALQCLLEQMQILTH